MALVPTYQVGVECQNTPQEFAGLYVRRSDRTWIHGVCLVLDNSGYFSVGFFAITFTLRLLTPPLGKDVGGDSVTL